MSDQLKHFALLASVFDDQKPLPGVPAEVSSVNAVINRRSGWQCSHYPRVTLGQIQEAFSKKETPFQIFHFAGHAFDEKLQFNQDLALASTCLVFPEGLAPSLRRIHPVELVMLNGCSTATQVRYFLDSGVKAVVATHRPLKDEFGALFAAWFYFQLFHRGQTLRVAYQEALNNLAATSGPFKPEWLNLPLQKAMTDRGLIIDKDPKKPVYELFTHSDHPDFADKTIDQWPVSDRKTGSGPVVPEKQLLLCDRGDQADTFEYVAETLAETPPKYPIFLFVHEYENACPALLTERFGLFAIDELNEKKRPKKVVFKWQGKWKLPERLYWRDRKACLKRLSGIYAESFPAAYEEAAERYVFTQTLPEEEIIVIHHDLNYSQVEWQENIRVLMEVYLDEFSKILATELSPRIAILFSRENKMPNSPFSQLFNELAAGNRVSEVHNLNEMRLINREDIGNWVQRVFTGLEGAPDLDKVWYWIDPQAQADQEFHMKTVHQGLLHGLRAFNNPAKVLQP